jgi:beta-lactamase regulating signal transducer with metallopeptidase domain
MTLPYSVRLVCLCLEMLFLVNLAASVLAIGLSGTVAKAASRMCPQEAARWFLGLRLLPFTLSLLVIATLCVPSYLRYEQNTGSEGMGLFCIAAALMGLGLVFTAAVRGALALAQIYRMSRMSRAMKPIQTRRVAGAEIWVTDEGTGAPLMALVGVFHPRLFISHRLVQTLTTAQMEAALRHERAHLLSRDNLKRLLMAVMPGIAPGMISFKGGLAAVEAHWELFAELAADDHAAGGRADRSIALAETLVKVARLGNFERPMPLASSLSASDRQLALRVDRLMSFPPAATPKKSSRPLAWRYLLLLCGMMGLLAVLPKILHPLYRLLESLLH